MVVDCMTRPSFLFRLYILREEIKFILLKKEPNHLREFRFNKELMSKGSDYLILTSFLLKTGWLAFGRSSPRITDKVSVFF